jgi:CelD/BcsL family acetyltransferase involved in cellulose biosynthesis
MTPKLSVVSASADTKTHATLCDLTAVPVAPWRALHARAIEPNAYFHPLWALPVARFARGRGDALALLAFDRADHDRLIGLMPVRWAKRALSLPVPMLVGWNGYASLAVPTLDRDHAVDAANALLDAARNAGARALFLPGTATDGMAFAAVKMALSERGLSFDAMRSFRRAALNATQDGDTTLRAALGAKKLKELRRQRHRLEDSGPISIDIATTPADVAAALDRFLSLEQKGWKGLRGTGLGQHEGDTAFIRDASAALAAEGRFEIISLMRNGTTIASGLVLRDQDRAYFFKIAMDESEARTSPGVQLTLDLTRHLCADAAITCADSSADGEHPMIDHVWRERIEIADVFIPLYPSDPIAAGIKTLIRARYAAIEGVRTVRRFKEKLS